MSADLSRALDRIIATPAASEVPPALVALLAPGGRRVLPVGETPDRQVLRAVEKGNDGATSRRTSPLAGGAG